MNSLTHFHLVGIKGTGMTALAGYLLKKGKIVSGSDVEEKFFTDEVLKNLGIAFKEGFNAANIPSKTEILIHSTAFSAETNPEILAASEKGLKILTYPEALAEFFNEAQGVAVAGSHGKTTTSALLANTLTDLGFSPSAIIGSKVLNWQNNSLAGESDLFVIEADEHQNKLRFYAPQSIILNNIDYDHPDFYPTVEAYVAAFADFVERWAKRKDKAGLLVINQDDAYCRQIVQGLDRSDRVVTFGRGKRSDFCLKKITVRLGKNNLFHARITLRIKLKEKFLPLPQKHGLFVKFASPLAGGHNAANATAVFAFLFLWILQLRQSREASAFEPQGELGQWFCISLPTTAAQQKVWLKRLVKIIEKSLLTFLGTERRLQFKGKIKKTLVFDDFAHHPSEIAATLKAVRGALPRHRLVVLFQPHTFSRTEKFLSEFAHSLVPADQIGILKIYASARESGGSVSARDLADLVPEKEKVVYFENRETAIKHFSQLNFARPTVFLTFGAGDGFRVGEKLILRNK